MRLNRKLRMGTMPDGSRRIIEQAKIFGQQSEVAYSSSLNTVAQGMPSGTSVGGVTVPGIINAPLDDFIPDDPVVKRRLYREMYFNDPIVGMGVDLLSTFPFSDFTLIGVNDEMRLRKYAASVDMLDIRTLLPQLSRDFLVVGKFIGSLNWNKKDKIFDALLPHNIDLCKLQNVPIYGVDPVVTLEFPEEIKKLIKGGGGKGVSQQLIENIKRIPQEFLEKMTQKGGMELDSDNLIYIARSGMIGDFEGVSALSRILPVWLVEKAMMRGTLDQVWKRQRGILHAQLGGEEWEPTKNDFQAVQEMILSCDSDPTGAVMVTRSDVNIQEIRRGDDFWRWDMITDWSRSLKLQALGISETFISGEGTISAMEGAVSVSLAHFKAYRSMLTKQIFYDKVFPTIAVANNFKRKGQRIVVGSIESDDDYNKWREERAWQDGVKYNPISKEMYAEFAAAGVNIYNTDLSQYAIPKVSWNATLDENTDTKLTDLLKVLEEHGVPVPLRTWVASAQMTVEDLLEQKESDVRLAKFFFEWRKEVKKLAPNAQGEDPAVSGGPGEDGSDNGDRGGGFSFASSDYDKVVNTGSNALPFEPSVTGIGLLNRDFGEMSEPCRITHKGTPGILSKAGQDMVNDRVRKRLVEAAVNAIQKQKAKEKEALKDLPTKRFPLSKPR